MFTNHDDPLEMCPYDKAHQIRRSRMQIHIVKCRKHHPTAEMQTCPFNATHIVPVPDYQFHLRTCPSKTIIEQQYYRLSDERESGEIKATAYNVPDIQCEEDWESEQAIGYDPNLRTGPAPIFLAKQGATESERKAFRLQQRMRVQEELSQNDSRPSSALSSTKGGTKNCFPPPAEKPARPREPKTRSLALQGVLCNRQRDISAAEDDIPDEVVASMGGLSLGRPIGRGMIKKKV